MKLITTHIEMVAFDLGMQAIARHQMQTVIDAQQGRLVDLEKALTDNGIPVPPVPGQEPTGAQQASAPATTVSPDGRQRVTSYGAPLTRNGNGPAPGQEGVDGSDGKSRHVPASVRRGYDHIGKDGRDQPTPEVPHDAVPMTCDTTGGLPKPRRMPDVDAPAGGAA